jgi:hypothetical protein
LRSKGFLRDGKFQKGLKSPNPIALCQNPKITGKAAKQAGITCPFSDPDCHAPFPGYQSLDLVDKNK